MSLPITQGFTINVVKDKSSPAVIFLNSAEDPGGGGSRSFYLTIPPVLTGPLDTASTAAPLVPEQQCDGPTPSETRNTALETLVRQHPSLSEESFFVIGPEIPTDTSVISSDDASGQCESSVSPYHAGDLPVVAAEVFIMDDGGLEAAADQPAEEISISSTSDIVEEIIASSNDDTVVEEEVISYDNDHRLTSSDVGEVRVKSGGKDWEGGDEGLLPSEQEVIVVGLSGDQLEEQEEELSDNEGEEEAVVVLCDLCECTFPVEAEAVVHMQDHHNIQTTKGPYFKCPFCRVLTADRVYHMKKVHYSRLAHGFQKCANKYLCLSCDYASSQLTNIRNHVDAKHSTMDKSYVCLECNTSYKTLNSMRAHKSRVHARRRRLENTHAL